DSLSEIHKQNIRQDNYRLRKSLLRGYLYRNAQAPVRDTAGQTLCRSHPSRAPSHLPFPSFPHIPLSSLCNTSFLRSDFFCINMPHKICVHVLNACYILIQRHTHIFCVKPDLLYHLPAGIHLNFSDNPGYIGCRKPPDSPCRRSDRYAITLGCDPESPYPKGPDNEWTGKQDSHNTEPYVEAQTCNIQYSYEQSRKKQRHNHHSHNDQIRFGPVHFRFQSKLVFKHHLTIRAEKEYFCASVF